MLQKDMQKVEFKIRKMSHEKAMTLIEPLITKYGTEAFYEELMRTVYRHIYDTLQEA